VTGDLAFDVGGRDTGLAAERRNDRPVDVVLRDGLGAEGEQQVDQFVGLAVQPLGLAGSQSLPCLDGLAHDRVDGLGERGAGLVNGHVQQADDVVDEDIT
jgi:hypothetical protein